MQQFEIPFPPAPKAQAALQHAMTQEAIHDETHEASTPIRRADYAVPAYRVRTVDLTFDLDAAKTLVSSRLAIERDPSTAPGTPLRLDGEGLTLLRCLLDGEPVAFRLEDDDLVIDNPPDKAAFTLELRNTCAPEKNTELVGLFVSGGGLFTQCEAEGFRCITYFTDRPDVMAVYTVTLRADKAKYPVLLSNGNLLEEGDLPQGRHFAKWHDPFPKPSYLFAIVAADLVAREQRVRAASCREHLLQVYVRRGDLDKTDHAMASLVASIVWDERRFGLPLDLDRFMVVAVSDFNAGAMENKGLNIFNTKYVLASAATATDDDFLGVESIIGHEYFHNWTGNRITCRDWFQLSLKEGLTVYRDQEFSADMAGSPSARAVKRIDDVTVLREAQFPEDAGPMAHPVRPDEYEEVNNFYTATVYDKGAEVVRMQATLVGREGFRRGMDLYFQRHDGTAATCDDFAQAIADANPASPLAQHLEPFKRWYAQAGTPRVGARGAWDEATRRYVLTLTQSALPSPGQKTKLPFVIPVQMGLVAHDGRALPLQLEGESAPQGTSRLLVLTEAEQSFTFVGLDAKPVPSLLRGFSAPVHLDDGLADDERLVLLTHDEDAFNRWEQSQKLALARILSAVGGSGTPQLDDAFIDAMRRVLADASLDAAFRERVLTLPDEVYIAECVDSIDPVRIHAVREAFLDQMARTMHADFARAWEANQVTGGYRPDHAQSGRRALANWALYMLVREAVARGDAVWPGRAYQRVKDASNMTDRFAALEALVDAGSPLAEQALAHFHRTAGGDELVLDKWFAVQAGATERLSAGTEGRPEGPTLAGVDRVKALMTHPDFSLRNPNRLRALVGTFVRGNPGAFHRADASGYAFWADRVIETDPINPQVASRMARGMDRWRALVEPYRSAARAAIERVAAAPGLSDNTREIVGKALRGESSDAGDDA